MSALILLIFCNVITGVGVLEEDELLEVGVVDWLVGLLVIDVGWVDCSDEETTSLEGVDDEFLGNGRQPLNNKAGNKNNNDFFISILIQMHLYRVDSNNHV